MTGIKMTAKTLLQWNVIIFVLAHCDIFVPREGWDRTHYFLNDAHSMMIELRIHPEQKEMLECQVLKSPHEIKTILRKVNWERTHLIGSKVMVHFAELCEIWRTELSYKAATPLQFFFPGTKWCGIGTEAKSFDDLGSHSKLDKCCRTHDYCPEFLSFGETKHGLVYNGIGTILHCTCDEQFAKCLQENGDTSSQILGVLYFNVFQMSCFKKEYPIVVCLQRHWITNTCQKYMLDTSKPTIYQKFDPLYFAAKWSK